MSMLRLIAEARAIITGIPIGSKLFPLVLHMKATVWLRPISASLS